MWPFTADGDHDWTWNNYYNHDVYTNHSIPGYTETNLENILAKIDVCDTSDEFGCDISDDDLRAAANYTWSCF